MTIDTTININGMQPTRYIAAKILDKVEYKDEQYYELEDYLTKIIDIALLEIHINQNKVTPLIESNIPEPDKPMDKEKYLKLIKKGFKNYDN